MDLVLFLSEKRMKLKSAPKKPAQEKKEVSQGILNQDNVTQFRA